MRELKFRAWDTKRKKMWLPEEMGEDQLTLMPDGQGFINVHGTSKKLSTFLPHLIPEQYTGLKDKNGKEIYAGDIVKTFDEWVSEICFGHFQSHVSGELSIGFYCKDANGTMRPMSTISSEYEIIGDIHTKPELLEKPK